MALRRVSIMDGSDSVGAFGGFLLREVSWGDMCAETVIPRYMACSGLSVSYLTVLLDGDSI